MVSLITFVVLLVILIALILAFTRSQDGPNALRAVTVTAASVLENYISNLRVYRNALKQCLSTTTKYTFTRRVSRIRSIEKENEELKSLLSLNKSYTYPLQIAQVVTKQLNTLNNSLSVNLRSIDSIQRGMPLINSDGLSIVILVAIITIMPLSHLFHVSV